MFLGEMSEGVILLIVSKCKNKISTGSDGIHMTL